MSIYHCCYKETRCRTGVNNIQHWFLPTGNRPYFGEVTNDVRSVFVDFGQDVEDKRLHVKVKRLVVEEEFC